MLTIARTRSRPHDPQLLLVTCAAVPAAGAAGLTAAAGVTHPSMAIVFLALVTAGELCRLTLPGGRQAAPVATASAVGYGLLGAGSLPGSLRSAAQAVAVAGAGIVIAALAHAAAGRKPAWQDMSRRMITTSVTVSAWSAVHHPGAAWSGPAEAAAALALLTACGAGDLVLAAWLRAGMTGGRLTTMVADEWHASGMLRAATGAAAVLLMVVIQAAGLPGIAAFAVPIVAVQAAYRRLAGTQAVTLRTMKGLPRILEVAGYVHASHIHRVSQLAAAIGRQIGMREHELLDLEYAALLHDIGQFALPRPVPGGVTILSGPSEQQQIARAGAEMINKTGHLAGVADIVLHQYEPCPAQGQTKARLAIDSRQSPPLASRIIKAANAYDDMAGDRDDKAVQAATLDIMALHAPATYDPLVIRALRQVLAATPGANK